MRASLGAPVLQSEGCPAASTIDIDSCQRSCRAPTARRTSENRNTDGESLTPHSRQGRDGAFP